MEYVCKKYTPVEMTRIADWLEGRIDLPDRAAAVTFDDGYRNVLVNAAPVLSRLSIPATVYIVTDFVKERKMVWTDKIISALAVTKKSSLTLMSKNHPVRISIQDDRQKKLADAEIRSICKSLPNDDRVKVIESILAELEVDEKQIYNAWVDHSPLLPEDFKDLLTHGIEIGSHTKSHKILSRCEPGEMKQELEESKKFIENVTGKECDQFAYPNGKESDFNEQTRSCVRKVGYRSAVTTIPRRLSRDQDSFEIPRLTLTHNKIHLAEFAAEMSGYPDFLRSVKRNITFGR
jgi:peptidoglycan/xylan/chitin deacetylase (PgdA/CDA1 family)